MARMLGGDLGGPCVSPPPRAGPRVSKSMTKTRGARRCRTRRGAAPAASSSATSLSSTALRSALASSTFSACAFSAAASASSRGPDRLLSLPAVWLSAATARHQLVLPATVLRRRRRLLAEDLLADDGGGAEQAEARDVEKVRLQKLKVVVAQQTHAGGAQASAADGGGVALVLAILPCALLLRGQNVFCSQLWRHSRVGGCLRGLLRAAAATAAATAAAAAAAADAAAAAAAAKAAGAAAAAQSHGGSRTTGG
eukprot:scaffold84289_cov67-Phaeocystis_antarctica.AAC.2